MKKNVSSLSFLLILSLVLLLTTSTAAQEPVWLTKLNQQKWMKRVAGLKLLKTSRAEAEKILGKPRTYDYETANWIEYYDIENGTVVLTYTTKECTSINGKISKDTIEEVSFNPEADISLSELKLPLKQFTHSREDDNPTEHYINEQYGIDISIQNGKLSGIDFDIPEQKNFSCVTVSTFLNDLDKVKNLKLLESNREDVRKIFAEYKKSSDFESSAYKDKYFTGDATIEIFYSQGKCLFDDSDEYDSPEWNVERITVSPDNYIFPKEFGIDLANYKKEKVYKNRNDLYIYHDKDKGISIEVVKDKIDDINFFPPQKYNSLMCDRERAKKLSATNSLFTEKLKERIHDATVVASVKNVYLSKREIFASSNSNADQTSQSDAQKIIVFTRVNNPNNDYLIYSYTVSGGKITGRGDKVIWDLSGVKPGVYRVTAAVDDGCGFCGKQSRKTIVVK